MYINLDLSKLERLGFHATASVSASGQNVGITVQVEDGITGCYMDAEKIIIDPDFLDCIPRDLPKGQVTAILERHSARVLRDILFLQLTEDPR